MLFTALPAARAQGGMTIIRDTEIEDTLKTWSTPIIKAAGLEPGAVNIIIVQSDMVNAFVAGGPNIFMFTGLLKETENPGEVAGVIAHELGHIRGGHLIRMRQAQESASYESILGAILGIGVAIATGEGGAGAAVSAGASGMAVNRYLSHSRVQESSADQAAIDYLGRAGLGADGLVTFLEKLGEQDLLPQSQQVEYARTHPITRNRVNAMREKAENIALDGPQYPPAWDDAHARMQAKLMGFIMPQQVSWHYGESDNSIPALYARAIAAYRLDKVDAALGLADRLLAREADNPYFLELKGQMLKDFGRVAESVQWYRRAASLRPGAPLIEIGYAHALLESAGDDRAQIRQSINLLSAASAKERRSTRVHRLLATAYGRIGEDAQARLHLAEEALLQSKTPLARQHAEAARQGLQEGSREWLRAGDILLYLEQK
jgi:predicted Zn-dependent protease